MRERTAGLEPARAARLPRTVSNMGGPTALPLSYVRSLSEHARKRAG
jgi:hypothetical protein